MRKFLAVFCSVALFASTFAAMPNVAVFAANPYEEDGDIVENPWGDLFQPETEAPTVALAITSQPKDVAATAGDTVKISVVATGDGLSYQWQQSSDDGITWKNTSATGNTTSEISLSVAEKHVGKTYLYRCVISSSSGKSITSDVATVTVKSAAAALAITKQPSDKTVEAGNSATISIVATGTGLTYQWQQSSDGGSTWKNTSAAGNTTNAITLSVAEKHIGKTYLYKCIVTDASGKTVTSNVATVTVVAASTGNLAITKQPSDKTVAAGDSATISIVATGTGLTYQWQQSSDGGSTWKNTSATGNTTNAITLSVAEKHIGKTYLYKCVVTDASGKTVTSSVATVTIVAAEEAIDIQKQPTGKPVIAGDTIDLQIVAYGTGLTYQWEQSSDDGNTWKNTTAPGGTTDTVQLSVLEKHVGKTYLYRCIVTDANGNTATSDVAVIEVVATAELTIVSQPQDSDVAVGEDLVVTVTAVGLGLTYQWYQSSDGGTTWKATTKAGGTTDTVRLKTESKHAGMTYMYKCVITDATGATITSDIATVKIK